MENKVCYICKKDLPISQFRMHSGRPDGLRAECKKCSLIKSRAWTKRNKEYIALFREKYFIQSGYDQKNRHDIKGLIKRDYPQDGYCEICGKNNKRLAYHHWDDSFPSWGIWMCAGCHVGCNFVEKPDYVKKYWQMRKDIEQNYNPDLTNVPMGVGELKQMIKDGTL